jgi:type II secretory pathway pseudopilin PulG
MNNKNSAGFTLIEAIVILVATAVVAAIVYTYFGDQILKSHKPRENLVKSVDLNQVMANIRADYKPYPVWKPNYNYSLNDKIMPSAYSLSGQQYWYKCQQAGVSGSTEPDPWIKGPVTDNTVQWAYQMAPALLTLSALKNKIGAEDANNKKYVYDKSTRQYGYYVINNKWIDFDPSTRIEIDSSNQNILKVTIGNDNGERITALFF